MATVALGIAATIFTVGASSGLAGAGALFTAFAVGATVGSVIDNTLVFPAIYDKRATPKPVRFDDLEELTASEGRPIRRTFGATARVTGQVIWTRPIRKLDIGTTRNPAQRLEIDIAIAFAEVNNPISQIKKMWADDKLLYEVRDDPAYTVVSDNFEMILYGDTAMLQWDWDEATENDQALEVLANLRIGDEITISGFTGAQAPNNGAFTLQSVIQVGDALNGIWWFQHRNLGAVAGGLGQTVTLSQVSVDFTERQAIGITVYNGSDTQNPDPLIQALEGLENTPAYRRMVYVVIEGLNLNDYGFRIPTITALIEEKTDRTVGETILEICELGGIDTALVDTSSLPTDPEDRLEGYTITEFATVSDMLDPIMQRYNLIAYERDGILEFVPREGQRTIDIDAIDLAAGEPGQERPRPLLTHDISNVDIPREVDVTFVNPETDYLRGVERERFDAVVDATPSFSIVNQPGTKPVPMVMTRKQAREIAARLLYQTIIGRQKTTLRLPFSYMTMRQGDRARLTAYGETFEVILNGFTKGSNFVLEYQGTIDEATANQQTGVESPTDILNAALPLPGYVHTTVMETTSLLDSHNTTFGVYLTCALAVYPWLETQVYESQDNVLYEFATKVAREGVVGIALTQIGGFISAVGDSSMTWDRGSTVDVFLVKGILESRTELEVLNGANRIYLNRELTAFTTATLIAPQTYRLSGFLRGLGGTQAEVLEHAIGEDFTLVDPKTFVFYEFEEEDRNVGRYFKGISSGNLPDEIDEKFASYLGFNTRPYSVGAVNGHRVAGGTGAALRVRWDFRTRGDVDSFISDPLVAAGQTELPLQNEFGGQTLYEITFFDATGTVPVVTFPTDQAGPVSGRDFTTLVEPTLMLSDGDVAGFLIPVSGPVRVQIKSVNAKYGEGLLVDKVLF